MQICRKDTLRQDFGVERMVMVGDRGKVSQEAIAGNRFN